MSKKPTDNEILDMLSESFRNQAENIELPEALSTENIVSMLKAEASDSKPAVSGHSSDASVEKAEIIKLKRQTLLFKRAMAVAAAFVFISTATCFAFASNKPEYKRNKFEVVVTSAATKTYSAVKSGVDGIKSALGMETKKENLPVSDISSDIESAAQKINNQSADNRADTDTSNNDTAGYENSGSLSGNTENGTSSVSVLRTVASGKFLYRLLSTENDSETVTSVDIVSLATTEHICNLVINKDILGPDIRIEDFECVLFDFNYESKTIVSVFSNETYTVSLFFDVSTPYYLSFKSVSVLNGSLAFSSFEKGKLMLAVYTDSRYNNYSFENNLSFSSITTDGYFDISSASGSYTFISVTDVNNLSFNNISLVTSKGLIGGYCERFAFNGDKLFVSAPYENEFQIYSYYYNGEFLGNSGSINTSVKGKLASDLDVTQSGCLRFIASDETGYRAYRIDSFLSQDFICSDTISSPVSEKDSILFTENVAYLFARNGCYRIDYKLTAEKADETDVPEFKLNSEKVNDIGGSDSYQFTSLLNDKIIAVSVPDNKGNVIVNIISENGVEEKLGFGQYISFDQTRSVVISDDICCIPVIYDSEPYYCIINISENNISSIKLAKNEKIMIVDGKYYDCFGNETETISVK